MSKQVRVERTFGRGGGKVTNTGRENITVVNNIVEQREITLRPGQSARLGTGGYVKGEDK